VLNGGWANRNDFVRPLDKSEEFLVVTEGSSDSRVIGNAFRILHPHIADFFRYVDMEEGYPFSGTGNLYRFVQGLVSIGIQNNVIVVFDNDAEGVASFDRCSKLNIPSNMRILKLPDEDGLKNFKTIGPNGNQRADINGRAASIECYLDLDSNAAVRWANYNSEANAYQGALVNKERYAKEFIKQRTKAKKYDYRKISRILDMVIRAGTEMKEIARTDALKAQAFS
jgi:hypothetical protein